MRLRETLAYKLKGERNNRPRKPLVSGNRLYVIFVYDKKGFTESRIQCLNCDDFSLVWEYTLGHVINNIELAENQNLLASGMDGRIVCFDRFTGGITWEYVTTDSNIGPISNVAEGRAVFSGIQRGKKTYCIDTRSGTLLWEVENTGHSYIPVIYRGFIFNAIGNDLYCLDLHTGATLWKANEPRTYLFNPKIFGEYVLASGHGIVNVYEIETGRLVFSIAVPLPASGKASAIREIVSDAENIYFGDAEGNFYCYGAAGPQFILKWKLETKGAIESVPLLADEQVLVINNGLQLLCIDKNNGDLAFEKKTKGEAHISGLTGAGGSIYFSCGGGLVCKYEKEG